ncbi:MAG TPA: DUF5985 family protein [Verrucomicrobiae bacterium]|jgi:hypothetical protein|nr:DUF5985 family protein [Verrucomicrobiae bacterium]
MSHDFIKGAIAMAFLIVASFFFRFWRESRDRLFGFFAAAFFLMAVNRPVLVFLGEDNDTNLTPYLIRLASYAIIIIAIVDKNVRRT